MATPDTSSATVSHPLTRADARAARLRSEHARHARQRIALLTGIAVLAVAGTAFALRPLISPGMRPRGGAPASVASTATAEATAPAPAGNATATTSPDTTASVPASPSVVPTAPASTSPTAGIKPLSPKPGVKTIVVYKRTQWVVLYKADGTPVDRFRCASGVMYPRLGTYRVWGRAKQSWALSDNTTFFYFTKFARSDRGNSIGFHSIPQTPSGKLVGGLGKPISHGCVRLDKKKAKFIYTWARNGTKVIVKK